MKAGKKGEELTKVSYRLPAGICDKLEELAVLNRRSINDELVLILQDYFNMPVKWEKWIEKSIKEIAQEKGYTISWALNFLVGMKLSDMGVETSEDKENSQEAAGQ
jgi:TfoX/Sxy family transcriptional regulator of competence genes